MGKGKKNFLPSFFPFPPTFLKAFFPIIVAGQNCVVKAQCCISTKYVIELLLGKIFMVIYNPYVDIFTHAVNSMRKEKGAKGLGEENDKAYDKKMIVYCKRVSKLDLYKEIKILIRMVNID